jgi:hypothetical protein
MANQLQRAAFRRRVFYGVAIFALFTLSLFWRGKLAVPFSTDLGVSRWLTNRSVLAQAKTLELRELDMGDPEIAGETARLAFVGARGMIVTALWTAAIEKQKRGEFDQFEILARAVTTLQPHFITPWVFQSWNIAYNISVENDKLGDMYFYIARGIELLSEGDRQNTKTFYEPGTPPRQVGSPDMRYQLGFYYQNKFSVSDKVQTLRSLMQLSCIKPQDRSRSALETDAGGERRVDEVAFRRFCEANPQLVRRLRVKLNCERPADVVQFLADNASIPTLYSPEGERLGPSQQFPILPSRFPEGPLEYTPESEFTDTFDAFHAARAWFLYSLPVLPPPKKDEQGDPLPWRSPKPGEYDASRYRMPRSPALVIFRQQGPRAQTYLANRLADEGWFDSTSAWEVDDGAGATTRWFPPTPSGESVALKTADGSQVEWQRAFDMWDEHGERTAMKMSDTRRQVLMERAETPVTPTSLLPELSPAELAERGLTVPRVEAHNALVYYDQNRSVTNFAYFLATANAEKADITVAARKLFWAADQARASGRNNLAVTLYRQALAQWRYVLATFKDFHRPANSEATEEATYESEMKLLALLKEDGAVRERARKVAEASAAVLGPLASRTGDDYLQAVAEDEAGLQTVVEAVESVYPKLQLAPGDPREELMRRVGRAREAAGAFGGGVFSTPAVTGEAVPRAVVDAGFAWMKEYKTKPVGVGDSGAAWVRPEVKQAIRQRLGLVRAAPTAPPAGPETQQ